MVSAIVCAAGKGSRANFEKNKLLYPLPFENTTVLEKTVSVLESAGLDEIVVAVSTIDEKEIATLLKGYPTVKIVLGGQTRTESVKKALSAVQGEIVLIHDGARPFVTVETILTCIEEVKKYGSAICATPMTDTVAVTKDGNIISVPNRDTLYSLQTPQGFITDDIRAAYEKAEGTFTDDSAVYNKYVKPAHLFIGNEGNKKLTYRADFSPSPVRAGVGIDTHAFGNKQDYIVLAGVHVPSDSGLVAHSDGDVLIHAVMDALLSAAGLRDIGYYFPDKGDTWKDADSRKMLAIVKGLVKDAGFAPLNLSVAVQAQKPRLSKFVPEMVKNLAYDLDVEESAVGLTVGTNEGLGYVGEGKGITVTAYALLTKI